MGICCAVAVKVFRTEMIAVLMDMEMRGGKNRALIVG